MNDLCYICLHQNVGTMYTLKVTDNEKDAEAASWSIAVRESEREQALNEISNWLELYQIRVYNLTVEDITRLTKSLDSQNNEELELNSNDIGYEDVEPF